MPAKLLPRGGVTNRLDALALVAIVYGLAGVPLALGVAADGAPLIAAADYVAAAVLTAAGLTLVLSARCSTA